MSLILVCCPPGHPDLDTMLAEVLADHGLHPRPARRPGHRWWALARAPMLPARHLPGPSGGLLGAARDGAGHPVCVGGPVRELDLDRRRAAARQAAERIWRIWDAVVFDTPPAQPQVVFWRRHRADPAGWPAGRVRRAFAAQPRVRALRDYDWRPDTQPLFGRFRPDAYASAVEELQTGRSAFVGYHQQQAVLGEALVGCDGRWLSAAGPSFTDRAAYAATATAYLAALSADTVLVAVEAIL